jgi:hypothetical protein
MKAFSSEVETVRVKKTRQDENPETIRSNLIGTDSLWAGFAVS